jgi:hypothetical protein
MVVLDSNVARPWAHFGCDSELERSLVVFKDRAADDKAFNVDGNGSLNVIQNFKEGDDVAHLL